MECYQCIAKGGNCKLEFQDGEKIMRKMLKEYGQKIVAKYEERKAKAEEIRKKKEQEDDEEFARRLNEFRRECGLPERDYISILAKNRINEKKS